MNTQLFVSAAACIALAIAIGNAFIKTTSSQFKKDPSKSAYNSSAVREQTAQKAQDTAERQRRMMENLKNRMDRNKF